MSATPADPAAAAGRPLLVTADPDLLDELLRLAAAADVEVEVAPAGTTGRAWASAPLVVVGADAAQECARGRLPRRDGVLLVSADLDDGGVWERAVALGAEHVAFLPDGQAWLVQRFADAVEGRRDPAPLLAVLPGRGGAGATSLSCALAVTAARRGSAALLVDGDRYGGGIDLCLGAELDPGLRWPELSSARGRLSPGALSSSLPRPHGVTVLSYDRTSAVEPDGPAAEAVLRAGRRSVDVAVVDLAREFGEVARAALPAATMALLVVPAEVRAVAAAARVAAAVLPVCRDVRLVVREPGPCGLRAAQAAQALGLPLAGVLAVEPGLARDLECGQPPGARSRGALARLADELLDEVLAQRGPA